MNLYTCTMCNFSFDPSQEQACQACPMHNNCAMICCPACGHTSVDPERSRLARWVAALFPPKKDLMTPSPVDSTLGVLLEVPPGARARVVDFIGMPTRERESLQAYGLVPGCWVRVVQHAPVTVIQFENTELALEADLASRVQVEMGNSIQAGSRLRKNNLGHA